MVLRKLCSPIVESDLQYESKFTRNAILFPIFFVPTIWIRSADSQDESFQFLDWDSLEDINCI